MILRGTCQTNHFHEHFTRAYISHTHSLIIVSHYISYHIVQIITRRCIKLNSKKAKEKKIKNKKKIKKKPSSYLSCPHINPPPSSISPHVHIPVSSSLPAEQRAFIHHGEMPLAPFKSYHASFLALKPHLPGHIPKLKRMTKVPPKKTPWKRYKGEKKKKKNVKKAPFHPSCRIVHDSSNLQSHRFISCRNNRPVTSGDQPYRTNLILHCAYPELTHPLLQFSPKMGSRFIP